MTTAPRSLRGLVPLELAIVIAVAFVPLPVPGAVPLVTVASLSRWLRGRSWVEVSHGGWRVGGLGAAAGAIALAVAVLAGTPVVEWLTGQAVEWSTAPIVRGNATGFVMIAIVTGCTALAAELVLRGWIVERVLELGRGPMVSVLAILVGAAAEALLAEGGFDSRLGAGVFGAGLGWMYVAGKRSVVGPIGARLAFVLGGLVLETLRLVG